MKPQVTPSAMNSMGVKMYFWTKPRMPTLMPVPVSATVLSTRLKLLSTRFLKSWMYVTNWGRLQSFRLTFMVPSAFWQVLVQVVFDVVGSRVPTRLMGSQSFDMSTGSKKMSHRNFVRSRILRFNLTKLLPASHASSLEPTAQTTVSAQSGRTLSIGPLVPRAASFATKFSTPEIDLLPMGAGVFGPTVPSEQHAEDPVAAAVSVASVNMSLYRGSLLIREGSWNKIIMSNGSESMIMRSFICWFSANFASPLDINLSMAVNFAMITSLRSSTITVRSVASGSLALGLMMSMS
mmetsp:Transcript_62596/g.159162  ORF Transcript_62596/g.159162 Transcript_62596/m.159162 type:complete len:293 (-) Transcript_62596:308-1186(-)